MKTLLLDTSDKILTITLNRPQKLNALTPELLDELKETLDKAAADEAVSVVVIRSTGRVFCAGYDLNEEHWVTSQYPANHPGGVDYEQDKKDIDKLLAYWLDMWRFPKPIITAVQGACLSGAGELLAVSDLVVAMACGEDEDISPRAAKELVIVGAAVDCIVARAAIQRIAVHAAFAANDGIVAPKPI